MAKETVAYVDSVRHDKEIPPERRPRKIASFIDGNERQQGSFFRRASDGEVYFFDGITKRVLPIYTKQRFTNEDFAALLYNRYGLVHTQKLTKHVVAILDSYARCSTERVTIHRFSHYDRAKNILYLSRYDGTYFRLDGKTIEVKSNGHEILFLDDDGGVPCEADFSTGDKSFADLLINDLQYVPATQGGLTADAQRVLFHVWSHLLPFAELLPAKPLLILEGEKGSGKTSAVKRLQLVVKGSHQILNVGDSTTEEDFSVALLRNHVAVLDNIDRYIDWLANALATYATGGVWIKRQRYTDDAQASVRPKSFIAITTRNPTSLYRDDVADRSIVIRMERRADKGGFAPEGSLLDEIERRRPQLYGEWLTKLNQIIAGIPKMVAKPGSTKYRLADFANLAFLIGNVLGYSDAMVEGALQSAQDEREEFMVEADPLAAILTQWLDKPDTQGIPHKPRDLFVKLSQFAEMLSLKWPYRTDRALAIHLRNNLPALERHFKIEAWRDPHTKNFVYSFSKKET